MADITETLARIVNTQADEIARLRKVNADLIADSREQAATIRTLIDQRGAAEVKVDKLVWERLRDYWYMPKVSLQSIADCLSADLDVVAAIIDGYVEPLGELRQRIEALIGGEVGNE